MPKTSSMTKAEFYKASKEILRRVPAKFHIWLVAETFFQQCTCVFESLDRGLEELTAGLESCLKDK